MSYRKRANGLYLKQELKSSAVGPLVAMHSLGKPVWTPRDYAHLSKEGYEQNVVVYRCVNMIANAVNAVPLMLFEGENELFDHPVLSLLKRPNPLQSKIDFFEYVIAYLLLAGNTYIEGVAGSETTYNELYILRPDRMKVVPGNKGFPSAYEYKVHNRKFTFPVDSNGLSRILHIKSFHPTNDYYGLAGLEPGAYSVDVHNESSVFNKSLLENGATPSGVLIYKPPVGSNAELTSEQKEHVKDEMDELFTGPRNAGRPLLLEGYFEWKDLGIAPKDLQFTEGKNMAAREIAMAFNIPPQLLGIPGDNTFSNYREANFAFWTQTVLPLVNKLVQAMSAWLRPLYGDQMRLGYDVDQIEALSLSRERLWKRLEDASWLTLNEKRKAAGYDRLNNPAADQLFMNANQLSLDDIVSQEGEGPEPDDDTPSREDDTDPA